MQFIRFTFLSALLLAAAAFGQSNLPACKGSDTTKWSNCIGTATFKNSVYVGEWKGGKSHGQGTETRSDGAKYVGEFKNDQYNGQGTITFADGNKYVGEFKDGTYNGQGTATFANGDKYVGEYKNNNRNGQGTATYSDGNKYVGEFKDDKANGQGIYTTADGKRQEGTSYMVNWSEQGHTEKTRHMRTLLRDYVLVLKNTGVRHGTEALGLRWRDIAFIKRGDERYLQFTVTGKTGRRTLIAAHHTEEYLRRLQLRQPTLAKFSFEDLLKKKINQPVFKLATGETTKNLAGTFRVSIQ